MRFIAEATHPQAKHFSAFSQTKKGSAAKHSLLNNKFLFADSVNTLGVQEGSVFLIRTQNMLIEPLL